MQELEFFLGRNTEKKLIVILGPTASGKTAFGIKLAKEFNGEIISADSRQIYRGMDISTDKIGIQDQEGIVHHMMDIVDPDQDFTLAQYQDRCFSLIDEIYQRKKNPFLVGGTGLYIDAVCNNYDIPRIKPNQELRELLYKEYEEKGADYLWNKLEKLDKESAESIDRRNHRYLIRALEINLSGKTKSLKKNKSKYKILKIGIKWDREILYQRINERVDYQVERGLIDEVKKIHEKYGEVGTSITALGVRQIIPYLKKEKELDECIDELKRDTRRYAKRQITWFKRDESILWIDGDKM